MHLPSLDEDGSSSGPRLLSQPSQLLSRVVCFPFLSNLELPKVTRKRKMYSQSFGIAAVLALAAQTVAGARAPKYDTNSKLSKERAEGVKEAFQFAWDGYYKYAFPHDELHPVSNSYSDSRSIPPETPKNPGTDIF